MSTVAASRRRPRRPGRGVAASIVAVVALLGSSLPAGAEARQGSAPRGRFVVPASARELVVVSSPGYDPPGYLASLRTFARTGRDGAWKAVFASWPAEIGSGELRDVRREGDHATPTGVYGFGATMYGIDPDPGGLHEPYHRLVCGDWWDEDPYSAGYNRFEHVACGTTPSFAAWSEPLWQETRSYPYLAVIDYNMDPTVAGPDAPGSGIFLHAWMDAATEGCIALPIPELLEVLRWLRPADHPVIEIGTDAEIGRIPPA